MGTACGPVQYVSQVTQRAAMEVAAARTAGADKLAPYEFVTAELYLHKAREEAGFADYQAAIHYGKKAEIMARKARRLAIDSGDAAAAEAEETPAPAPVEP